MSRGQRGGDVAVGRCGVGLATNRRVRRTATEGPGNGGGKSRGARFRPGRGALERVRRLAAVCGWGSGGKGRRDAGTKYGSTVMGARAGRVHRASQHRARARGRQGVRPGCTADPDQRGAFRSLARPQHALLPREGSGGLKSGRPEAALDTRRELVTQPLPTGRSARGRFHVSRCGTHRGGARLRTARPRREVRPSAALRTACRSQSSC